MNVHTILFSTLFFLSTAVQAQAGDWFSELHDLIDDLERMSKAIESEYKSIERERSARVESALPICLEETVDGTLVITILVPDADSRSLKACIEENILTGRIANPQKTIQFSLKDNWLRYTETAEGRDQSSSASQVIMLPCVITDWAGLKLTYDKKTGVLSIRLPKSVSKTSNVSIDIT